MKNYNIFFVTETGTTLSDEGYKKLSQRWPAGEASVYQGQFLNDPEQFLQQCEETPPLAIVVSLHFTAISIINIEKAVKYVKKHKSEKRSTYELLLRFMAKNKLKLSP